MAVAEYVPAVAASTTQVKTVWVALVPATGPVLLAHELPAPLNAQVRVPPGAVAPVIPVMVAM